MTTFITGCGDSSLTGTSQVEMTTEPVTESYSASSIDRTNMLSVAQGFINAIRNNDFDTALQLVDVKDNTFFTTDNLDYVIHHSSIGYLVGDTEAEIYGERSSENAGAGTYVFYTDSSCYDYYQYKLELKLDDSNLWVITKEPFVVENFQMYVPKNVRFYLNDVEVPLTYKTKTENSLDVYTIPYISRCSYDTAILSSTFGEIDGSITVPEYTSSDTYYVEDTEPIEINRSVPQDKFDELMDYVVNLYNNIYTMMDNDESPELLDQYIGGEKNYKWLEEYYVAGINARMSTKTGTDIESYHQYTNTEILEYWQNPAVESYVFSDDTIVLNMVLKQRWLNDDVAETEMICAGIKLTKTPGGDWLINDITSGAWTRLEDGLDESMGVDAW